MSRDMYFWDFISDISFQRRTRCSWQETKVWNPGATPKPSWSMNGGSSWVWIWTLIPASNDVSSVDKKRWGHFTTGMMICMHTSACWIYPAAVVANQTRNWLCCRGKKYSSHGGKNKPETNLKEQYGEHRRKWSSTFHLASYFENRSPIE